MASVKILLSDLRRGNLPNLCIRCGAPTTDRVTREFYWYPWKTYTWLAGGVLFFMAAVLVDTKRIRTLVPLCRRHQRQWPWRSILIVALFFGIPFFIDYLPVLFGKAPDYYYWEGGGLFCLAWIVVPLESYDELRKDSARLMDQSVRENWQVDHIDHRRRMTVFERTTRSHALA